MKTQREHKTDISMRKKRNRELIKDNIELLALTLPGLALLIIFNYIPMFGIIIAFKNYNPMLGILGSKWVGLDNFRFFFTSQDAFRVIRNTVAYGAGFLIIDLLTCVGLALMFYFLQSKKALKVYNSIVILPKFMSVIMVAFIVYGLLNPSQGLLSVVMRMMGKAPIQWYSEPKYWPFILCIVHVWMAVGMGCVIYYSSLMGMDESLLEAASLDGAGTAQKIISVIIPYLKPVMIISTILGLGHIFNGDFGLFYQVPQNVGLLYPTTDIINTYTYRALVDGSMAKSTAVGLFQSAAGFVMVMLTNLIVRKISPEDSLF